MHRVLIVDDDLQGLYMLEALMKGHGYEVETAVNGAEALEKARRRTPDIIISDFFMPIMDGLAFCRECKKDDRLKDTPFVAYTATYTDPKDEEVAIRVGAARFLVKPIEPNALLKEIKQVLADAKAGKLPPPPQQACEDQYLREYSDALVRKLEAKVIELQEANDALNQVTVELRRSNRDLEQFAYVASHDLQEPLRMVSSFLQLITKNLGPSLDKTAGEYMNFAIDGAMQMKALVDGLLAYSRVGTKGRAFQNTSAQAAVDAALANLRTSIEEARAVVTCEGMPTVRADPVQLTQLFQNLVGNAVKYRGPAPLQIHIGSKEQPRHWLFWVRDNGIGMDPQFKDRVFVIFQRLHTREEYPGTGIGLALCKRIVERHGGEICVESSPGKGATFFFSISKPMGSDRDEQDVRNTPG